MPIVTISRQFGAGGHTLGKMLSQKLGYQLVDRDICRQIAEEAKVSIGWVESVERDPGGLLMRICNKLVSSDWIERHVGDKGDFDSEKYVSFVTRIIKQLAKESDLVVVGRGSQFILPNSELTVKVLLVADLEDRIKFLMDHYQMTKSSAEQLVRLEEKRRVDFLKLFDSRNPDDPSLYTLVFNTSRVTLEETERMILDMVGKVVDEYSSPIW